jgi:alginate O-acetyltransferase complex protein AlgI
MLFNTQQFAIFFCAVLILYWGAPKRARNGVLLAASILFYGLWIPSYLLLLFADIGVNYGLLRIMVRSSRPRLPLTLSIVFTLSMLAYFKYAALLVESLLPVLAGDGGLVLPEIFLPLGISFYSFQIIALAVDTHRRRIDPVPSLARYSLFISFFPQLVAGPILRGQQFLPQLEAGGRFSLERGREGIRLLATGILKKVVFAIYGVKSNQDAFKQVYS